MARRGDGVAERRWRERFGRFRRWSLTVGEFCEREGVSTASFYAWKRKLERTPPRRVENAVSGDPPLFVPVSVRPVGEGVRIELPGGAVVRVPADADRRLVGLCIRAAAELGREAEAGRC